MIIIIFVYNQYIENTQNIQIYVLFRKCKNILKYFLFTEQHFFLQYNNRKHNFILADLELKFANRNKIFFMEYKFQQINLITR